MTRRALIYSLVGLGAILGAGIALAWLKPWAQPQMPSPMTQFQANAPRLPAPESGLRVFHLGHSLVGRDMPAMLQQLAVAAGFDDHTYESQLGWGTSLRSHW